MSKLPSPLHLAKWLSENEDKLKPPIGNYMLQVGHGTQVMAVGGPNARTDFHVNETEEWFYQYRGNMTLRVFVDGDFKDINIDEGEMYLLPGNVPHSPIRYANTVGIVIEKIREPHHIDRLRWYCKNCKNIVVEESFHCVDLGSQLKPIVERYANDETMRTCKACGTVNEAKL
ncbi:3-hydroxyanthranilic acid dioxygenase [Umbelopsis sp. WA50703]